MKNIGIRGLTNNPQSDTIVLTKEREELKMLLGIIIGICIWQLVVGFAQFFDFDEDWVMCPLFCILLVVVKVMLDLISIIQNWRVYMYLISLKINPFGLKMSRLRELTEKQQKELLSRCRGKYYNSLKIFFAKM